MSADDVEFEADLRRPRARRAGADRRRRRLRRPARPAADARAAAEGRSREDLDPGAGRPVSRLHRGGAQAAARTRRRLSRDGGVARLSEIAPAAARDRMRPKARAPRTWRMRWRCGCKRLEAIRAVAEQLFDRAAARPRRVPPRRSRADRRDQASAMVGDALRSAVGLCAAAPEARARARALAKRTVWSLAEAREALERLIGADRRTGARLDEYPDRLYGRAGDARDRAARRASPRRSNWCAKGMLEVHQQGAFAPIYLRKRQQRTRRATAEPGVAAHCRRNELRRAEHDAELVESADHAAGRHRDRATKEQRSRTAPEELRLLEALLFAAAEPLDEKALAARLPAGRRRARGAARSCRTNTRRAASISCASAASGRSAPRTIWPGC